MLREIRLTLKSPPEGTLFLPKHSSPKINRCSWAGDDPVYIDYHDNEWGIPVHDDKKLFEMLILEGFQAGLSWITILKRRENFRTAFDNWDWNKIARYDTKDFDRLMNDAGIIRNRLKIKSAINNAQRFIEVRKEFGTFDRYMWQFTNYTTSRPPKPWKSWEEIPARTKESDAMSKDLKKRGFTFVGSIICYAHMQAVGMVDDHIESCFKCKKWSSRSS
ncbi:MAG: DNA-3-methyladenine glycosylase I [Chitinivibrionales bacterium]|nr:DNA-3-methyladenine glycosylase I [Chitinivibrionales bacterium]